MTIPSPADLATLQAFLVSDAVTEECYDYIQSHGFLTALAISPIEVPEGEWLAEIFVEPPEFADEDEQQEIEGTLRNLADYIARELYSGKPLRLPCPLLLGDDPDAAPLRGWALGFMDGVSLREDAWFEPDEEEVGELLLPIALAAGVFEDDHLEQIYEDPHRLRTVLAQIPDAISELYLLYREE